MYKRFEKISLLFIFIFLLSSPNIIEATSNSVIEFKDKNLQDALCKFYNYKGTLTKEKASELSEKEYYIYLENSDISDLEGIQYFDNTASMHLSGNDLINLKPLSKLKELLMIDISNNTIKGREFEKALLAMDRNEMLFDLTLNNDGLTDIDFLENIGNIKNYGSIMMQDNKINDISILKNATNLYTLDLSNNRITDVQPLKDLKDLVHYLDLHDNCIIDYKPLKQIFDDMYYYGFDYPLDRYDFYTNPVNFKYNGKQIKFPYLTVYYKNQGYAEAIPLFKALGGSAEYDKKTGTLTCKYDGKTLVMKDFSTKYTLNGKEKKLTYPMRRMQYDLAYVPVKDICKALGLEYKVVETRDLYLGEDVPEHAPKLVEIYKREKELG